MYEKTVDSRTQKHARSEYEQEINLWEIMIRQEEEQNSRDRQEREEIWAAIES